MSTFRRVRNTVIFPDGSQNEPLGSGIITGLLGVGGMANVYEIWNNQLEISRAVKLLHPNYTEEAKQRFDTEIKITAKLHHANIIEIHAVGYWNGLPYIEMERIDGDTLETLITKRGAFPVEVCTAIGVMIGRALQYAHHQEYAIYGKTYHGVIHRDLKPSNIMISNIGVLKLMDFGIARPTDTSIHTTDGSILGTMQYLSPEQLEGKDADIRTDIFSMGALLYEMITGQKAFPEKNAAHLMVARLKNDFKPLDSFDIKIPLKLKDLIYKCMAKDREKRVRNTTSFLSDITKIHKTLTDLSPEQVVEQFIKSKEVPKIVLTSKFKVPVIAFSFIISAGLIGSTFLIYGSQINAYLKKYFGFENQLQVVQQISAPQLQQQVVEPVAVNSNFPKKYVLKKVALSSKLPAEKVKPELSSQISLIDQLSSLYGTSDILTIFVKEVKNRNYQSALEVFSRLTPAQAASVTAVIYKIRLLKQINRNSELHDLLMVAEISDAEFYLEKARWFLNVGNSSEALKYLDLTSKTSASCVESSYIRQERLYLVARCKSLEFDRKPSIQLKNHALECWYELKAELQTTKDHQYFKEADLEMQRITQKINSNKG